MTGEFGGSLGSIERRARYERRCSAHRREVWLARRRAHRRRLAVFTPLALAGLVVLVWQLTAATPAPVLVGIGMAALLPLLVEAFDS